jgi:hypothetical protein
MKTKFQSASHLSKGFGWEDALYGTTMTRTKFRIRDGYLQLTL